MNVSAQHEPAITRSRYHDENPSGQDLSLDWDDVVSAGHAAGVEPKLGWDNGVLTVTDPDVSALARYCGSLSAWITARWCSTAEGAASPGSAIRRALEIMDTIAVTSDSGCFTARFEGVAIRGLVGRFKEPASPPRKDDDK